MNHLQAYLQKKLCETISGWNESGIYALSFLVSSNPANEYKGCFNVTEFCVSYNTEKDCTDKDPLSETRWNYAFWRQNETPIIIADSTNEGMKHLFAWYKNANIDNVGYENPDCCYDDKMNYIGKGPVGYFELLMEIAAVAKNLQESGFIQNKFGKPIPIIIHDLEYPWYVFEATRIANPHGEADTFFAAMEKMGVYSKNSV